MSHFILRLLLLLSLLPLCLPAQADISTLGEAINKAGRQRMLSQRMLKDYALIGLDVNAVKAQKQLDAAIQLFDSQLAELEKYAPNKKIRKALGDRVSDVRVSHRLVESPASIVLSQHEMALYLQQMLKQAGQFSEVSKPVLEINPGHPLVRRIEAESDEARIREWSELLLDQAILAEGGQLEDPGRFVSRINRLLVEFAGQGDAAQSDNADDAGKQD